MPVHDWTRVDAGIFHDFHHEWISTIKGSLNRALEGTDYYALAEQIAGGAGPEVLTLQRPPGRNEWDEQPIADRKHGGVALATTPPQVRFHRTDTRKWYANKKNAVVIRHISEHRVVAVLEIISPGNKSGQSALAVGDVLPSLALFLTSDEYVSVPLEPTYQAAFDAVPEFWRDVITAPA